tara:strand:+ start:416 stop:628 length:213 start_codon:yes stop_codon:yes gene_type:complete
LLNKLILGVGNCFPHPPSFSLGIIRRILLVVGLLGVLAAAEGLNRFGSFVSAFCGADSSSIFTTGDLDCE